MTQLPLLKAKGEAKQTLACVAPTCNDANTKRRKVVAHQPAPGTSGLRAAVLAHTYTRRTRAGKWAS